MSIVNRARLLDVAANLFAKEGIGALTVRRLAKDLGTSTMALYSHFSGKHELIAAVADEFVIRFERAMREVPVTDDPLFDFIQLTNTYRAISLANSDLYRVAMISGRLSIDADTPRGIREMYRYCADAAGRCLAAGLISAADQNDALMVFWTGVHGQVALEMEQVFADKAQANNAWNNCFEALLTGLSANREAVAERLSRSLR